MYKCPDCDREIDNIKSFCIHRSRMHDIASVDSYVAAALDGVWPTCECGCGERVTWASFKRKFNSFKRGHSHRINIALYVDTFEAPMLHHSTHGVNHFNMSVPFVEIRVTSTTTHCLVMNANPLHDLLRTRRSDWVVQFNRDRLELMLTSKIALGIHPVNYDLTVRHCWSSWLRLLA